MIIYYLLITVMPLERHYLWTSLVGGLTMIKYVGGLAALYALGYAFVRSSRIHYFRTWTARTYLLYAGATLVSYACTNDMTDWASTLFATCLSNLLMFFVTITVVDSVKRLRRVLLAFVGAVAFASLYAIRDWQKYHGLYDSYRPSGAAGDPNYFCLTAIFCIPVAFYLGLEGRSTLQRLFCLGSVLVIMIAVTLGASRGGFLGLIAVAVIMTIRVRRHRWRYVTVLAVLLAGPGLVLPNSPLHRLVSPSSGDIQNGDSRTVVWKAGLRMIAQEPLFGIGAGRFKAMSDRYQDPESAISSMAHNTYIEIAAEMGAPVFLCWCFMIGSSFKILGDARMRGERRRVPLVAAAANGVSAGMAGALFCIFFISAEYEKDLWLFIFLSIVVHSLSLRCHRVARPAPATGRLMPIPTEPVGEVAR